MAPVKRVFCLQLEKIILLFHNQLRKNKELRETIELEQESKRHLEETLRMEMDEKDDQIDALRTQVRHPHKFSLTSKFGTNIVKIVVVGEVCL